LSSFPLLDLDFQCPPTLPSLSGDDRSLRLPGSDHTDLSPAFLFLGWGVLLKVGLGLLPLRFSGLSLLSSRRVCLASALRSLRARLLDFSLEDTSDFLSPSRDLTSCCFSPRREKTTDRGYLCLSQSSLEVLVSPLLSQEKTLRE
jgi:hypothetical protein